MTRDETEIFTDFEIRPEQVFLQRVVISTDRPGPPAPMIFKTPGGAVLIDGHEVSSRVNTNNRQVLLNAGDRVILFASYDPHDRKWLFWPTDVFNVAGNIVMNELPPIEPYRESLPRTMTIDDFAGRVRTLAARLGRIPAH